MLKRQNNFNVCLPDEYMIFLKIKFFNNIKVTIEYGAYNKWNLKAFSAKKSKVKAKQMEAIIKPITV